MCVCVWWCVCVCVCTNHPPPRQELAAPYIAFVEAGAHVDIASVKGGEAPVEPKSLEGDLPESVKKFQGNPNYAGLLKKTHKLADVDLCTSL